MQNRRQLANAIRTLAMDAVQQANSGHPGMPMGMADIAEVLWNDFLRHNPNNPKWINRDRFVLSNGHGSLLQYALLHLTGYALPIEEIKNFRQLHSMTPGHPEFGYTPGVETTTGPLGQGFANAVGMALAERALAAQFNRDNLTIIDHYTYVFLGDGCLMEGISHEAASFAGMQQLGKLIAFYDDNNISIDGEVDGWFRDNTPERFRAYGWRVIENINGHDAQEIKDAIIAARENATQPTLICCKTIIGFGAPTLAGTEKCHGSALGEKEVAAAREKLNWQWPAFVIPTEIYAAWDAKTRGEQSEQAWQKNFDAYQETYPQLAQELIRRVNHELPSEWQVSAEKLLQETLAQKENIATRQASQKCLNALAPILPELIGGSADLTGSNSTLWKNAVALNPEHPGGNYIYYGVREFGMSAIMNGLALHGGFIPYGGTFLTFTDYARNAVRLSALMKQQVIFIYSHDSIGLGEDGPTHQPVEHAAMLRLTPGLDVWRPCDTIETAIAWESALENKMRPSCLLLSRQTLPFQTRTAEMLAKIKRGAYILRDCTGEPEIIIIATGSEVALAVAACEKLQQENRRVRVVSMPASTVFDRQPAEYQQMVLPANVTRRIAIEAAAADFWYKYVGLNGRIIGMNRYGESAPANAIFKELGFTVENVLEKARELLAK